MTQADLADRLGTDQGNVSRIERGKQGFDSDLLFKLAGALELPLTDLFHRVEGSQLAKADHELQKINRSLAKMARENPTKYEAIRTLVEGEKKPGRQH